MNQKKPGPTGRRTRRNTILAIMIQVFEEAQEPSLSAKEVIARTLQKAAPGQIKGKTPEKTIRGELSRSSRFVRIDRGRYRLAARGKAVRLVMPERKQDEAL